MSIESKDSLARWLPLIVSIIFQIGIVAYGYGKLEQRITPLENYVAINTVDRSISLFVTRTEWSQRNTFHDAELSEMRAALVRMEVKLDKLLSKIDHD